MTLPAGTCISMAETFTPITPLPIAHIYPGGMSYDSDEGVPGRWNLRQHFIPRCVDYVIDTERWI